MSVPIHADDWVALARARLGEAAWAYFDGGAADEATVAANRSAWAALKLWPRLLQPLAGGHTRTTLLGREWPVPLLLAPVAYQRLAHTDGERATALAAAAQGVGLVLSAQSSVPLEDVAALVRDDAVRGPLWFQVYPQPRREDTLDLARRAADAGFEALVLTADAPVHGVRDRERRTGFALPPGVCAVNLPPSPAPSAAQSRFDFAAAHAVQPGDIEELARFSGLPVLVKGVLHPGDVEMMVNAGAAGLVVSNHGGRTLDTAPATAEALPLVARALRGRLPLLVDGGIRRGTDVLKALALGADAVLIGRPQVMALAAGGAAGVAQMLRQLRDELEIAMALCGCATLAQANAGLLSPD